MSEDWENQELEEKDFVYHRSLLHWSQPGAQGYSRDAYWLGGGGSVKSGSALLKKYQAFWKHATSWERAWSNLAFRGLEADPLVDVDSNMVVGHVGWFRENVIWFAPKADSFGIGAIGPWDVEALVASQNPRPGYYHLRNIVPPFDVSYLLVTDIGGRVLAGLAYHDADQIESSSVTPLDLLLVIKLVVSLTGTLVGKIVPTIAPKLAKPTMSNGLRELTAKEMASYKPVRALTSKELTLATGGHPGPFLADNSGIIGRGLANDVQLAQIYLKSPEVQTQFGILERELIALERNGPRAFTRTTSRSHVDMPARLNPPRLTGQFAGADENLSRSAERFRDLPKVSATPAIQKHIELVMKRAAATDPNNLGAEAAVAYDVLRGALYGETAPSKW